MASSEDSVRRFLGTERVVDVRRFEAGERHHVYRVSFADAADDVVVRVSLDDTDDERDRAEREAAVLRLVDGAAAPRLLDFQCPSEAFGAPAMCLEHIDGDVRDFATASSDDLVQLGRTVARVHALPTRGLGVLLDDAGPTRYAEGRVRTILAAADRSSRDPLAEDTQERIRGVVQAITTRPPAAQASGPLVLLHGDVAPTNTLWTADGPVLIDWEYARLGDPADEVAYVFGQNDLSQDGRDAFWHGYGTDLRQQVSWWEPLVSLGSSLWWFDRWFARVAADAAATADASAPRSAHHYLGPAMRRLAAAEALLTGSET